MQIRNPVLRSLADCGAVFFLLSATLANAEVFNCTGSDTACLVDSINTANANGEDDTINLESGTYTLHSAPKLAADRDLIAKNSHMF